MKLLIKLQETYPTARIEVLYDLNTQVRTNDISRKEVSVYKLQSTHYLYVPELDKRFPEDIFPTDFPNSCPLDEVPVEDITHEPKITYSRIKSSQKLVKEYKRLEDCESGDDYPITLKYTVFGLTSELKKRDLTMMANHNQINISNLEHILTKGKREFCATLKHYGLHVDKNEIYYRMEASKYTIKT